MSTAANKKIYALGAEFATAPGVYKAAEMVRDAGYKRWDVHTPFPVHGLDAAMGLGKSPLGYIVFFGGLTGFLTAVCLEFIPSSILYPMIVQGKPTNWETVPAFVPIMFELTVLISAFTTLFGMLLLNGLPRLNHPVFNWDRFKAVTDDKFFVVIEHRDPLFDMQETRALLEKAGGTHITVIEEDRA